MNHGRTRRWPIGPMDENTERQDRWPIGPMDENTERQDRWPTGLMDEPLLDYLLLNYFWTGTLNELSADEQSIGALQNEPCLSITLVVKIKCYYSLHRQYRYIEITPWRTPMRSRYHVISNVLSLSRNRFRCIACLFCLCFIKRWIAFVAREPV